MNVKHNSLSKVCVIDHLNVWSDFREIKYKKKNIDFHDTKYENIEEDTLDFFKLFFEKYIVHLNIDKNNNFIFVMKKLLNYNNILYKILDIYKHINIRFIIIESKFSNDILDKNKDDFLCQYIFKFLMTNNDCILISNDKYRDKKNYVNKFQNLSENSEFDFLKIKIITKTNMNIENSQLKLKFNSTICNTILDSSIHMNRLVIPKNELNNIF